MSRFESTPKLIELAAEKLAEDMNKIQLRRYEEAKKKAEDTGIDPPSLHKPPVLLEPRHFHGPGQMWLAVFIDTLEDMGQTRIAKTLKRISET